MRTYSLGSWVGQPFQHRQRLGASRPLERVDGAHAHSRIRVLHERIDDGAAYFGVVGRAPPQGLEGLEPGAGVVVVAHRAHEGGAHLAIVDVTAQNVEGFQPQPAFRLSRTVSTSTRRIRGSPAVPERDVRRSVS